MQPTLLRIPRVDPLSEENTFVLVHISKQGSGRFDLKLIGTDNDSAFVVSLSKSQTLRSKDKRSNLSQSQWEKVLSVYLLGEVGVKEEFLADVELVASVEEEVSMKIAIRKRVEGITQPLGSIVLLADEKAANHIDLFEWCGNTIELKDASTRDFDVLRATIQSKDDQIKALEDSMAELVRLKTENEAQMLEKFSLLLNEKKLKIRDQQRLLACSNVDPEKLAEVEASRTSDSKHPPGPSRRGKRKVEGNDESEGSDDGFENMEVDEPPAQDSDHEQTQTPDEASDDDVPEPPPAPRPNSSGKGKGKETAESTSGQQSTAVSEIPPKRDLPFGRKQPTTTQSEPQAPSSSSTPADDGSETQSDDDEL